jgi:hypothetical protein
MYRTHLFVTLLVVSVFLSGVLWAHGNEKHIMGTVKAVTADSITVETTSHQVQTVHITSQTKFLKGDQPSSLGDLKVGDRVVIHAKPSGEKLEATEVKSGAQTHAAAGKRA